MARPGYIKLIFRKEILDTVRDRKTLLINLALPVLIWPLTAVFLTQYSTIHILKQQAKESQVLLVGEHVEEVIECFDKNEKTQIAEFDDSDLPNISALIDQLRKTAETGDSSDESAAETNEQHDSGTVQPDFEEIEDIIRSSDVDCVVAVDSEQYGIGGANLTTWILHDGTDPDSVQAAGRVAGLLDDIKEDYISERLVAVNLDAGFLEPLVVNRENIAGTEKTIRDVIGRILPLMLIVLVVLGGFYPAINMTAGEKEQGTLPTLLCAPIHHLELLIGKYLAILCIALVGVAVNVLSLSAVVFFGLAGATISVSPLILLYIFIALLPTAMLYTALFMSVAIFANTFREGQNLLSPVTLVAITPAYAAMLPGMELTSITAITPGINIALLIREMLVNPVNPEFVLVTLITNGAWTMAILVVAARIFASEQVLLGGKRGFADLIAIDQDAVDGPDPRSSTILFVIFLSGTFYLSGALLGFGIAVLVPILQIGLFVAVPLAFVRYFRLSPRVAFRLKFPRLTAILGAILVGTTFFVMTGWLAEFMQPPEEYERVLIDALQLKDPDLSLAALLVLIAVLPGFCEEFAFRGILLSGYLKGFRPRYAIGITAALFACAHFSIYNFAPLFAMGLVLGYAAWITQSIWPGVIIHTINNSLAVLAARHESWLNEQFGISETTSIPLSVVAGAAFITTIGLWLISRKGRSKDN